MTVIYSCEVIIPLMIPGRASWEKAKIKRLEEITKVKICPNQQFHYSITSISITSRTHFSSISLPICLLSFKRRASLTRRDEIECESAIDHVNSCCVSIQSTLCSIASSSRILLVSSLLLACLDIDPLCTSKKAKHNRRFVSLFYKY
jgi:hypothetical protein